MRGIDPVLGETKRCPDCGDWWPLDRDFFYFTRDGKPQSYCRACRYERNNERNARLRRGAAA